MRHLVSDQRGSLFIEFLIYMPLLMLIWWLMIYVHDVGVTGIQTARSVRECAWQHAVGGCESTPPACAAVSLSGTTETDDSDLHGRSSAFQELGADLPFTKEDLDMLLGEQFDGSRTGVVDKPPFMGGSRALTRKGRWMCEDRQLRSHTVNSVFNATCDKLLGRWCP